MVYGEQEQTSMYANTWYKPAPMNIDELRARAGQTLINWYDVAMDADDWHLYWLFDNELGCLSQAAQEGVD